MKTLGIGYVGAHYGGRGGYSYLRVEGGTFNTGMDVLVVLWRWRRLMSEDLDGTETNEHDHDRDRGQIRTAGVF